MLGRRAFLGLATLAAWPARAQTWPTKPVVIVVPFAAGGPTDLVARVLAEKLAGRLGQAVVVENRGGAGGDLGGQAAARSAPDGHTLLLSTTGSLTVNRHLKPNPNYDPMRDFKPISLTFKTDHVVVVARKLEAATLADLVRLAKEKPGTLSYGSAGAGATSHLIAELFKARAGVDLRHVPYRGAGPALSDLVAGHIDVMVDSLANAMPQIQAGTIRALAVTGRARHPALPAIPTAVEAGVPGLTAFAWGALLAPLGTQDAVIDRLSREVRDIYADAATAGRLAAVGADAIASTPGELAAFMRDDSAQWQRLIAETGIRIE